MEVAYFSVKRRASVTWPATGRKWVKAFVGRVIIESLLLAPHHAHSAAIVRRQHQEEFRSSFGNEEAEAESEAEAWINAPNIQSRQLSKPFLKPRSCYEVTTKSTADPNERAPALQFPAAQGFPGGLTIVGTELVIPTDRGAIWFVQLPPPKQIVPPKNATAEEEAEKLKLAGLLKAKFPRTDEFFLFGTNETVNTTSSTTTTTTTTIATTSTAETTACPADGSIPWCVRSDLTFFDSGTVFTGAAADHGSWSEWDFSQITKTVTSTAVPLLFTGLSYDQTEALATANANANKLVFPGNSKPQRRLTLTPYGLRAMVLEQEYIYDPGNVTQLPAGSSGNEFQTLVGKVRVEADTPGLTPSDLDLPGEYVNNTDQVWLSVKDGAKLVCYDVKQKKVDNFATLNTGRGYDDYTLDALTFGQVLHVYAGTAPKTADVLPVVREYDVKGKSNQGPSYTQQLLGYLANNTANLPAVTTTAAPPFMVLEQLDSESEVMMKQVNSNATAGANNASSTGASNGTTAVSAGAAALAAASATTAAPLAAVTSPPDPAATPEPPPTIDIPFTKRQFLTTYEKSDPLTSGSPIREWTTPTSEFWGDAYADNGKAEDQKQLQFEGKYEPGQEPWRRQGLIEGNERANYTLPEFTAYNPGNDIENSTEGLPEPFRSVLYPLAKITGKAVDITGKEVNAGWKLSKPYVEKGMEYTAEYTDFAKDEAIKYGSIAADKTATGAGIAAEKTVEVAGQAYDAAGQAYDAVLGKASDVGSSGKIKIPLTARKRRTVSESELGSARSGAGQESAGQSVADAVAESQIELQSLVEKKQAQNPASSTATGSSTSGPARRISAMAYNDGYLFVHMSPDGSGKKAASIYVYEAEETKEKNDIYKTLQTFVNDTETNFLLEDKFNTSYRVPAQGIRFAMTTSFLQTAAATTSGRTSRKVTTRRATVERKKRQRTSSSSSSKKLLSSAIALAQKTSKSLAHGREGTTRRATKVLQLEARQGRQMSRTTETTTTRSQALETNQNKKLALPAIPSWAKKLTRQQRLGLGIGLDPIAVFPVPIEGIVGLVATRRTLKDFTLFAVSDRERSLYAFDVNLDKAQEVNCPDVPWYKPDPVTTPAPT
ncbi:unnamed protein product [Amoebophrya sp. A120]|nr:unnamed protein product [Amoebophrya sp. A120]|eukprot:GSA120T00001256001.1